MAVLVGEGLLTPRLSISYTTLFGSILNTLPRYDKLPRTMEPPRDRPVKVMVVEDHAVLARLTAQLVEDIGCAPVGPARSIQAALALARENPPDVALVDLSLPDGSGADLITQLRAKGIRCVVVSAYERSDVRSKELDDVPWLEKPMTFEGLQQLVNELIPPRSG